MHWRRRKPQFGHAEAARVEPAIEAIDCGAGDLLVAVRIDVRAQSVTRADQIRGCRKCERISCLQCGEAAQRPPADEPPGEPGRPAPEPLAFSERQVQHVVEDEPVRDIEAAQGEFVLQIVGLVAGRRVSSTRFQPAGHRLHIAVIPGECVVRADDAAGAEALVRSQLQRVVAAFAEISRPVRRGVVRELHSAGDCAELFPWTTRPRESIPRNGFGTVCRRYAP